MYETNCDQLVSSANKDSTGQASSLLIAVHNHAVIEFDVGNFTLIKDRESGKSLLIDQDTIFADTSHNLSLARETLAKGDYQAFIDRIEDGFSCIGIDNGKPAWLLTDPFGRRRLYFYRDDTYLLISDAPLRLIEKIQQLDIALDVDHIQLDRFIRLGYPDEGCTFLNRVGRSMAGLQIRFDGQPAKDLLRCMTPLDSRFDEVVESCIYQASRGADGIVLLFSGGMDSTALLLACLEAAPDREIVCITAIPEPEALSDVRIKAQIETSAKIAKRLGVRHQYVTMDFLNQNDRQRTARVQPFDFGIANWLPAFRAVPGIESHLFLCGQNADSLSNFGHTAPFLTNGRKHKMMMTGKRLLSTRQFIESPVKPLLSPILQMLFTRSGKYEIARNDQEVFDYFFQPEMYRVPMAFKGAKRIAVSPLPDNYESLADELFLRNLRRYNDSSVARLFQTAALLSDSRALLPYSTRDVMRFFRHRLHASSTIEQLQGKYQIRRYVTKRIPKSILTAGYAIEETSNRRKIETKEQIRHDARRVWASVLPPPLDSLLIESLDAID